MVEGCLAGEEDGRRLDGWIRTGFADAEADAIRFYLGGGPTYGTEESKIGIAVAMARLSGTSPWRWSIALRQDLASLPISWGLNVSGSEPTLSYRVAEIASYKMGPSFGAFLEYKPRSNLSVRGSLNIFGDVVSERRIFDGPRDRQAATRTERQSLSQEAFAALSLRLSG